MASARLRSDLGGVYINPRFTRLVRAPAARYGDPASRGESFPAEAVLRDLVTADRAVAPLIAARYAALRFWLLHATGEVAALVDHARESALGHLEAADRGEEEVALLRALVERPEPLSEAAAVLDLAASEAERGRHPHGAGALREAAFRIALHRLDLGLASRIAADIGRRLRRGGHYRAARRWERAAARLATRQRALTPGSPD